MTFAVTPNGSVYEKDLGPKTVEQALAMTKCKSGRTWHLVEGPARRNWESQIVFAAALVRR